MLKSDYLNQQCSIASQPGYTEGKLLHSKQVDHPSPPAASDVGVGSQEKLGDAVFCTGG